MFARLLFESFRRQRRRKAFALLAIALGMTICTAMISVATDIGDKMNQELRTYSANLVLTPVEDSLDVHIGGVNLKPLKSESALLRESDLPKMKRIFWGHNIAGFAPFLSSTRAMTFGNREVNAELIGTYFAQPLTNGTESFTTGTRMINRSWQVEGDWPTDADASGSNGPASEAMPAALVGTTLAHKIGIRPGDTIGIGRWKLRVSGILSADGAEDQAVVAPLHAVQTILGRSGAVQKVLVSALTKPEDDFARRDPNSMSPAMRDRWYCSPYANSIALQIKEALPNVHVEQIRQVEQNQGKVLSRISGLMLLFTIAALVASALAVSAVMAATVIERRQEVGLMKSLGAGNGAVALLFLTEAGLLALAGGLAGFAAGAVVAHRIGQNIFGSPITIQPVVLAVVLCAALLVAFAGSTGAVRKAMRFDPALVLRGDA
jgi:putative ABC transport system permease protein